MKVFRILLSTAVVVSLAGFALAQSELKPDEFSAALSAYFEVSPEDVEAVRKTGILSDDFAVVMKVATQAKTSPINIAKLRARGDSWIAITQMRNMDANTFYMYIGADITSKTFAPVFEKYKQTTKSKWGEVQLTDADIINLVNLKFISSHYDYSGFAIMDMRDNGFSYVEINDKVKAIKEDMAKEQKQKEREAAKKKADDSGGG